jgi:hypothetical protein
VGICVALCVGVCVILCCKNCLVECVELLVEKVVILVPCPKVGEPVALNVGTRVGTSEPMVVLIGLGRNVRGGIV